MQVFGSSGDSEDEALFSDEEEVSEPEREEQHPDDEDDESLAVFAATTTARIAAQKSLENAQVAVSQSCLLLSFTSLACKKPACSLRAGIEYVCTSFNWRPAAI